MESYHVVYDIRNAWPTPTTSLAFGACILLAFIFITLRTYRFTGYSATTVFIAVATVILGWTALAVPVMIREIRLRQYLSGHCATVVGTVEAYGPEADARRASFMVGSKIFRFYQTDITGFSAGVDDQIHDGERVRIQYVNYDDIVRLEVASP